MVGLPKFEIYTPEVVKQKIADHEMTVAKGTKFVPGKSSRVHFSELDDATRTFAGKELKRGEKLSTFQKLTFVAIPKKGRNGKQLAFHFKDFLNNMYKKEETSQKNAFKKAVDALKSAEKKLAAAEKNLQKELKAKEKLEELSKKGLLSPSEEKKAVLLSKEYAKLANARKTAEEKYDEALEAVHKGIQDVVKTRIEESSDSAVKRQPHSQLEPKRVSISHTPSKIADVQVLGTPTTVTGVQLAEASLNKAAPVVTSLTDKDNRILGDAFKPGATQKEIEAAGKVVTKLIEKQPKAERRLLTGILDAAKDLSRTQKLGALFVVSAALTGGSILLMRMSGYDASSIMSDLKGSFASFTAALGRGVGHAANSLFGSLGSLTAPGTERSATKLDISPELLKFLQQKAEELEVIGEDMAAASKAGADVVREGVKGAATLTRDYLASQKEGLGIVSQLTSGMTLPALSSLTRFLPETNVGGWLSAAVGGALSLAGVRYYKGSKAEAAKAEFLNEFQQLLKDIKFEERSNALLFDLDDEGAVDLDTSFVENLVTSHRPLVDDEKAPKKDISFDLLDDSPDLLSDADVKLIVKKKNHEFTSPTKLRPKASDLTEAEWVEMVSRYKREIESAVKNWNDPKSRSEARASFAWLKEAVGT